MKGRMKGTETRGTQFEFGRYALKALEPGWITSRQIEAARRAMTREIKRGGNVWIKIFPDKPITAKPAETRMGSGKGNVEYWVAVVKPNRLLFELDYFPYVSNQMLGHAYDIMFLCRSGGMADAADSKSAGGNIVWVQVPPSALNFVKSLDFSKDKDMV